MSDRRIVRWKLAGGIGTDGATGGFTSAEGAAAYRRFADYGERWSETARAAQVAHDWYATPVLPLGKSTNAVLFSTGASNGRYPLYVGLDSRGRAVRFVLDFSLIRLDWPAR